MASKPEKKSAGKTGSASDKHSVKKETSKPAKQMEEGDPDEEVEDVETPSAVKKGGKTSSRKSVEDDDEADVDDGPDEWEKPEEEEEWDPDFEEFDLPKSTGKKTGKKAAGDEDDFKFEDDEFKDLLGDKNYDDDEEDDY
jgi:hypothetical protein